MIEKSLWQQIKDVVDCDKALRQLQLDITSHQQGITQDQELVKRQAAELAAKKQQLASAEKSANVNESAIKELKDAEDAKRTRLDNVTNQKEYKGFEKEVENLSRQRSFQEEQVVKQWFTVDALKKEVETKEQAATKITAEKEHDITVKQDIIKELEAKLIATQQARVIALGLLPKEWITQYERMKNSVADPMVPVLDTSCSACFYAIPYQDVTKVKKGNVIICRNCYRFLFYDEQAADGAKKASF
jgi:predicted  nucleic acid-binding Zn-ribbon protein